VQLADWIGVGDLLEEAEELLVAMPRVAGVGDFAGGHFEGDGTMPEVIWV
jgi:hypothetical protein